MQIVRKLYKKWLHLNKNSNEIHKHTHYLYLASAIQDRPCGDATYLNWHILRHFTRKIRQIYNIRENILRQKYKRKIYWDKNIDRSASISWRETEPNAGKTFMGLFHMPWLHVVASYYILMWSIWNNSRGAGNGLWSCRFLAFHDRPS